jgi:hypothetical protein
MKLTNVDWLEDGSHQNDYRPIKPTHLNQLFLKNLRKLEPLTELILHRGRENTIEIQLQYIKFHKYKSLNDIVPVNRAYMCYIQKDGRKVETLCPTLGLVPFSKKYILGIAGFWIHQTWLTLKE